MQAVAAQRLGARTRRGEVPFGGQRGPAAPRIVGGRIGERLHLRLPRSHHHHGVPRGERAQRRRRRLRIGVVAERIAEPHHEPGVTQQSGRSARR
ncbi:MAG: hypothetical protein ACKOEM_04090, partial [Planctomycetia bacterium]